MTVANVLLAAGLFVGLSDTAAHPHASSLSQCYARAFEAAGHQAVLIPITTDTNTLRSIVKRLDLVVLTGGKDVNPQRYGESNSPNLGELDLRRDAFEFALCAASVREHKPILGICRGVQLMNVFFGGSLYQHLPVDYSPPAGQLACTHRRWPYGGGATNPPLHRVAIVPTSRLARVLGTEPLKVNSHHHQGIKRLAPGFSVAARATDGLVEAIEHESYPAAGVQFHPENTVDFQPQTGFDLERHLRFFQCVMDFVTPASPDRGRAGWMQGRYGVMVHWLYPSEGDIDRWTDGFDLPAFLDDFRRTGADWLIFTAGQGRGAYVSPNAVFDRYCGEGHTSRRDLLMEIARGVKAQGKRFVVYSAVDFVKDGCANHAMQVGLDWKTNSVDRKLFERRWSEVLSVWSRRLGGLCDGWWLDGCSNNLYPAGVDWPRWLAAVRAGNADAAVAFNGGLYQYAEPWGPSDYTAGETMVLSEAEKVVRWLKNIPGHQRHYLFPIDGYWGAYWVWPQGEWTRADGLRREHPELFEQSYFDALQARGEFAPPIYSRKRLRDFMRAARDAGAGVTVNVGISPTGRLNPAAVELLGKLELDGRDSADTGCRSF